MNVNPIMPVALGLIVGLLLTVIGVLHSIDLKLGDIRTITSEQRDTLNCMDTPADPACAPVSL